MKTLKLLFVALIIIKTGNIMAQNQKKGNEIRTEIIIDASKEKVWEILSDFSTYPEWNPFIQKINGNTEIGDYLNVTMQINDKKPMTFKPKVEKFSKNEIFEWFGKTPLSFFNGRHYFLIEPLKDNQVKFIQGEYFTGWLVKPILKKIGNDTREGFIKMNRALKERAESVKENV